jgi:glycosyltransferase involved in cell wall biosynthesis
MPSPLINVTLPAHNEEPILMANTRTVVAFLDARFPGRFELVIADNASTDRTPALADELAANFPAVRSLHLAAKGRGGALRRAWAESQAQVLSYMDCDLSTGLEAFPALVEPVASGQYDLAVGSRLLSGSQTTRGLKRELFSRLYNRLVRALFRVRFSDAQCGFKAISRRAAADLLPLVEDNEWFFDTELLLLAEALGYRILDLPVMWVEEPRSHVALWSTALADIRGSLRLKLTLRRIRLVRRRCPGRKA